MFCFPNTVLKELPLLSKSLKKSSRSERQNLAKRFVIKSYFMYLRNLLYTLRILVKNI